METVCLDCLLNLHLLIQSLPLPHLLHNPEDLDIVFLSLQEETLFLGMPFRESFLRCPILHS